MSSSPVEGSEARLDAPEEEPSPPQRLYLHIGLPKSGSTFLQSILGTNRAVLKEHGYIYPFVRQEGMFHAAVEMAGNPAVWGLDEDEIRGTFERHLRRGRRQGGVIVISHEIFAAASDEKLEAIAEQVAEFEVHVVVTVRNTGRTITAQWQEQAKNGHLDTFDEFSGRLLEELSEEGAPLHGFWRAQNFAWLLERWSRLAPPERMHVVVTPVRDSGPDTLWRRFAEAIGLPPEVVDLSEVPRRNESLGVAQILLLHQVVEALDGRLVQPWYSRVVKRWFAQTLLSAVPGPKPVTPAPVAGPLAEATQVWVDFVRAQGYDVHGDLDELLPEVPAADARHPDRVEPVEMLEGLPGVLADMLVRTKDLRVTIEELEAQNRSITEERDSLAARLLELTEPQEPPETPVRRRRWRPF
jgi:hypothetical protein